MNRTATTIQAEIAAVEARLAELRAELAAVQAPAMRLTEVSPGETEAAPAPAKLSAKDQAKLDKHLDTALGNRVWVAAEPHRRDAGSYRGAATRAIKAAIKLADGDKDVLQAALDTAVKSVETAISDMTGQRKTRREKVLAGEVKDLAYDLGL